MRKHIVFFLFIITCLGSSITAQTFFSKITPSPDLSPKAAADTLKILAVMVDFQEDKDDATFGNGKFGSIYTKNYGQNILDPLPHDKDYFSLHLEFAKNYFKKVSNGKLNITYNVLPAVFTVSKTMRNYSPPNNSQNYTLLGNLAKEVWKLVSTQNPGVNFSDYDVFTIFHAGVGKDISLPGSLGTEKDLPSLYLGDKTLRNIFPSDLSGLPLNRTGQYNTMFIPETENREMSDITGGLSLIQISINGLIAANIGSHLGLPDLYDTKTGLSAIGRFGLMDGQAIFAYSGVFPPEPSPWEKMYLGWLTPVEINSPANRIQSLTANRAAGQGDTTVIRVPLTSTEYYLIENRRRDALNNGAVITYSAGGQTFTKTFEKDTTGFFSYSVDSLRGVVTDVDEFDWALPGNGIVIWHIDDNVINSKIASNQINTDKFNRGVDVEEADGVQDIGEKFTTVFGDEVVGEGTAEDFWYASNPSKLFKHYFDPTSTPPARSNSGANSPFGFYDFSDLSNKMTFRIREYGLTSFLTAQKKLSLKDTVSAFIASSEASVPYFYALVKKDLYKIDENGNILDSVSNFSSFKPVVFITNNAEYVIGASGSSLNTYATNGTTAPFKGTVNTGFNISSVPVARINAANQYEILLGTTKGSILYYQPGNLPVANPVLSKREVIDSTYTIKQILTDGLYSQMLVSINNGNSNVIVDSQNKSFPVEGIVKQAALTKDKNGKYITVTLLNSNQFNVISVSDGQLLSRISVPNGGTAGSFALGDLKHSGENYIVYPDGNYIQAVNLHGVSADNFPFEDPKDIGFDQMPLLIGGVTGIERLDNETLVYAFTKDGRIFEISGVKGTVTPGFPVSAGFESGVTPTIFNSSNQLWLSLVTKNNHYFRWNIAAASKSLIWGQENGNKLNSAFTDQASAANAITDFMPKDRAYNWPNPVYGTSTNIRYYVSEDSKINIKIFDLAGGFVAELNSDAAGGTDNETVWDVSGIQSGVYLARIEATAVSGKKENSIIKIAIIK